MARPLKNFLATCFRVNREKTIGGATLSVRTLCFSMGATLGAIGLFLPHNMPAYGCRRSTLVQHPYM